MTLIYPKAIQKPLSATHSMQGTVTQRNTVVLHITEGTSEPGCFATFNGSSGAAVVSAHFCVDRDAKVYQYVPIDCTAYHASQCNSHSIGIEHVALSADGAEWYNTRQFKAQIAAGQIKPFVFLPATEAQYAASAELVAWLCVQLQIPCDRFHVRTHNEASPRDHHVECCTGALDPDRLVNAARSIAA